MGIKLIYIVFALTMLLVTGCGAPQAGSTGKPIEPITPGLENGEAQTLQGRFAVRSADVQILDLSVTPDGSLAVIGTASRIVYLLESDGKLRWERQFSEVPQKTYIDPQGRFLAVGTAGGKVLLLNPDQSIRAEHLFDAPVTHLTASRDGELVLAGLRPQEKAKPSRLIVFDKAGREMRWENNFDTIIEARIVGRDNKVAVNWLQGDTPVIGMFSADGEKLWELAQLSQFSVDSGGDVLVASRGQEIVRYNNSGGEVWGFTAPGQINRIMVADNGLFVAALVTDKQTQHQELLYFDSNGTKLWNKRLPDDSDVVISGDGQRIIVSSWRQYRDDATHVFVYNQHGQEVNFLEVAGRAQKMALADTAATLALGLEDGSIYFLNIEERTGEKASDFTNVPENYYRPVVFGRGEGESRLTLYFFNETAEYLVPVTRRITRTTSVLQASLDELIRGPVQGSNLHRTIPKDAEIGITQNDGIVQVDIPSVLDEMSGSTFLAGVLDSLLLTLSQFPTVEQIRFTVAGKEQETFGQDGIMIDRAFEPRRFGRKAGDGLMFLPLRSGPKYYLRTETKTFLPLKDKALVETITRHVLSEYEAQFAHSVELESVRIENNIVYLDLSESLNRILTGHPEKAARAVLLRDALILSVVENVPYSAVYITVGGSDPERPLKHQPWELIVTRPYFVNMED